MTRGAGSSSRPNAFQDSWLRERCQQVLANSSASSGITPGDLAASILSTLMDSRSNEAIQEVLFEALQFDFDAVAQILQHRSQLVSRSAAIIADCTGVDTRSDNSMRRKARKATRGPTLGRDLGIEKHVPVQDLGGNLVDEFEKAFPGIAPGDGRGIGAVDKLGLPAGTEREIGDGFEEFAIPAPQITEEEEAIKLIEVKHAFSDRPGILRAMQGVTTFNKLQSSVFPIAYKTNENMLVCAPTGAGKTNVALLTVFQQINAAKSGELKGYKIVYVAPMKALAAEVVEKFGKKLGPLGLKVREFTGDMRLSYKEANETHILVTTPEKWDVVTRKSSSGLSSSITLLILDEVHLLHDDRGSVLESIIARTLRFSESAQRKIRLVGLSATLPNYEDVASFLRVDPKKGLFHFGAAHRPVPLSQNFIGVTAGEHCNNHESRMKKRKKMSELTWWKVKDSLNRGHQAMVFVHSRKQTAGSARELIEEAKEDGGTTIFLPEVPNPEYSGKLDDEFLNCLPTAQLNEIDRARSNEVRELCPMGIGVHHAGMQRPDRKLVEKLFAEGWLRVLCCTATLAWGVNLPARTVVIKGTEVYNSEKGKFEQLGMLDVKQIFGRAGRPQYDTQGEGTIITAHEHLGPYLDKLVRSVPIESTLGASPSKLADHLNAEIVSGTVTSIGEGVKWLNYTFLSTRMPKNPLVYGFKWEDVQADPLLHSQRASLVEQAASALDDSKMCRFDPRTGSLTSTELGRVCSYSYVSHRTVVLWNELLDRFDPYGEDKESDEFMESLYSLVIEAVSRSSEFEQMRSRNEEAAELNTLRRKTCPIPMRSMPETREGKVSILLQAHISGTFVRMSDLSYVVQSCSRLLRAFFEITLLRGIQGIPQAALDLARASDTRIWPFQHPLRQFAHGQKRAPGLVLQQEMVSNFERMDSKGKLGALKELDSEKLSELIRAPKVLQTFKKAIHTVPILTITDVAVGPVTRTLLRFRVSLRPDFKWHDNAHGHLLSWWFWIEDQIEGRIYYSEKISLNKAQIQKFTETSSTNSIENGNPDSELQGNLVLDLLVPVFDPPSEKYWVKIDNDYWFTEGGSSKCVNISSMQLPRKPAPKTEILDLRPIPVSDALPLNMAETYRQKLTHFYPIQTQLFDPIYSSDANIFAAVPLGSGKMVLADLAMFRAFLQDSTRSKCVVYMVLSLRSAKRRFNELKRRFGGLVFPKIIFLPEKTDINPAQLQGALVVATPKSWYQLSKDWSASFLVKTVSTVIADDLHLMGTPKGHELEIAISKIRMNSVVGVQEANQGGAALSGIRMVGLSGTVSSPLEICHWLGIESENQMFNFEFNARTVKCAIDTLGVADEKYFHRMQAMIKPMYNALQKYTSPTGINAIIFTSSAKESMHTAHNLIRFTELDKKENLFLGHAAADSSNDALVRNITDHSVRNLVQKGIGITHAGMVPRDKETVETLFEKGYISVVVTTFEDVWDTPLRSACVIVKGTEFFDGYQERYIDLSPSEIHHMVGKAGRPLDIKCFAFVLTQERKKPVLKKYLSDSLSVESQMVGNFTDHMLKFISDGRMQTHGDVIDFLSWTFFMRKVYSNPSYYGLRAQNTENRNGASLSAEDFKLFSANFAMKCIAEAWESDCLKPLDGEVVEPKSAISSGNSSKSRRKKNKKKRDAFIAEWAAHLPKKFGLSRIGTLFVELDISCRTGKMMLNRLKQVKNVEGVVMLICDCIAKEEVAMNLSEKLITEICESLPSWYLQSATGRDNRNHALDKLGITGLTGSLEGRLRVVYHGHLSGFSTRSSEFRMMIDNTMAVLKKFTVGGFLMANEMGLLGVAENFVTVGHAIDRGHMPSAPVSQVIGLEDARAKRDCDVALKKGRIEKVDAFFLDRAKTNETLRKGKINRNIMSELERFLDSVPILSVRDVGRGEGKDAAEGEDGGDDGCISMMVHIKWNNEFGRRAQRQADREKRPTMFVIVKDEMKGRILGAEGVQLMGGESERRVTIKLVGSIEGEVGVKVVYMGCTNYTSVATGSW